MTGVPPSDTGCPSRRIVLPPTTGALEVSLITTCCCPPSRAEQTRSTPGTNVVSRCSSTLAKSVLSDGR